MENENKSKIKPSHLKKALKCLTRIQDYRDELKDFTNEEIYFLFMHIIEKISLAHEIRESELLGKITQNNDDFKNLLFYLSIYDDFCDPNDWFGYNFDMEYRGK